MSKYLRSLIILQIVIMGACSTTGGAGRAVMVTHTYTDRTTVVRTVRPESGPVQTIKIEGPRIFNVRLAVKNDTGFPLKFFLHSPSLLPGDFGVPTFPASTAGFMVPAPDLVVRPGGIRTWTGQANGKPDDQFSLCWQTDSQMESVGECFPASFFLGRSPAPPLRLLITVRGDYPKYEGSGFSLAKIEEPRMKIPTIKANPEGDPVRRYRPVVSGDGGFMP